ncbi:MAG: HAMP domain-containing histidine kinase [Alphaproteobacteria bacterium]|nr:HAMP domain-containing histidine kinase [Alphaproteobacteria bacterium]
MFSYLRYFSVISLVVVVAGAIALSMMFTGMMRDEFVNAEKIEHLSDIDSFTHSVWRKHPLNANGGRDPEIAAAFIAESGKFFARQGFAKVTIFSPDVRQLYYGSTKAYVTSDGSKRITLFNVPQIQRGQIASRVLDTAYLTGSTDADKPKLMIQSIIPIMKPEFTESDRPLCAKNALPRCIPEALVEMYSDITPLKESMAHMQWLISGAVIIAFLVILGILMFTASRAEAIIARQHEVNLELTAAASAAEAQSRDKSQFLANISHELRTPLNAIIGFSDIIRNEARHLLDTAHQGFIDDIHSSGKHLLSLINDILDYSKAEAGKLEVNWEEHDLGKIIRNSLRMVMPRAETAQVMLVEDLPSQHFVMVTDSKKLKQVLLNLLSNAVKFTPAGGEVRCALWEDVGKQQMVIQVKDTGIGIAPKDISKVMMPFGQVDNKLSRKYEGTGLGLPLSRKFVELMGGEFTIESELNVGTSVTVRLPKAPKNWKPPEEESASNVETSDEPETT